MPISWNEIRSRAVSFSNEWKESYREEADAQPFLVEFLNIFGITRKRVATFEHRVKKIDDAKGYIDLLWPGTLLVEMKSRGENLEKAYLQAKNYCHGLKEFEVPPQIIICDFETFHVYDENGVLTYFELSKLVDHIHLFSNIAGYQKRSYKEQDPVNIEAAELMGKLHDKLKEIGYEGHNLELYLVRLLFILFADDTNIFEKGIFLDYLQLRTKEDGSDLAMHIDALFSVLNQPQEKRLKTLDDQINSFPYVNGKLFEERLPHASFDSEMRSMLLTCCTLNWGKISPAIFGSLFQSVMDEKARRNLGAHYTSEKNILKVIEPLFLDELKEQLTSSGSDKKKLKALHEKISKLKFLDPACGCGNFLIIAYRELRLLELEIVKRLLHNQTVTNISHYFLVDVDQFYGIEYEEFPSQIAQVAMWLIDHQMNMMASEVFGEYMPRIPLKKSPVIIHGNSIRLNWFKLEEFQNQNEIYFDYIFGNPPFIGKQMQSLEQKQDLSSLFNKTYSTGLLDYVTAWFIKSAQYIEYINQKNINHQVKVGFVSTNSITQGEQVFGLWSEMFHSYHIKIHFAHRTFKWGNEAKANAAVHVVIIGFSNFDVPKKVIFDYETVSSEPHQIVVKNINPYLVEGKDTFLSSRKKPLCNVPEITYGSMANDGGFLILSDEEANIIFKENADYKKFIHPFVGSHEFINGIKRWCLWLVDHSPSEYAHLQIIVQRIQKVREYRLKSSREATKKLAKYPSLFGEIRQPQNNYIIIPGVSSENRPYIPIGFMDKNIIASDLARTIDNGNLYSFGILTSHMHMVWVKYVCGRLKSDFRYSNSLVYNNYPWPKSPNPKMISEVEKAASEVLLIREKFSPMNLAQLYSFETMPPELIKAHSKLDDLVDKCYKKGSFANDIKRIELLFELYDEYIGGIYFSSPKKVIK